MARVIRERCDDGGENGSYTDAVEQALTDLQQDDDMAWLMNFNVVDGVTAMREQIAELKADNKLAWSSVGSLTEILKKETPA